MSDLDLTRYDGHTEGPWHVQECGHDTTYQADAYINGPEGCIAGVWGTRKASGQGPNARLIADAPLLLAEVRRLRVELAQAREEHHKLGAWTSCPQCVKFYRDDEEASVQYDRLRRSHARLLREMYLQRERWVLLKQVPDDPADQAVCAIRNLDAAVAEAEALNG